MLLDATHCPARGTTQPQMSVLRLRHPGTGVGCGSRSPRLFRGWRVTGNNLCRHPEGVSGHLTRWGRSGEVRQRLGGDAAPEAGGFPGCTTGSWRGPNKTDGETAQ